MPEKGYYVRNDPVPRAPIYRRTGSQGSTSYPAHRVKTGFSRGHGVKLPLRIFGGDNGVR